VSQLPLFDTNVLISAAYRPYIHLLADYFMATVVVQELLVGLDPQQQKELIGQANELHKRGRLIVPDRDDWVQVGVCLSRLIKGRETHGGHLTKPAANMLVRDALIARCAIKTDAQVITSDEDDFGRIKTVFRALKFIVDPGFWTRQ